MNAIVSAEEAKNGAARDSNALMVIIERAVSDPAFDLDRLQKLFDLKKQWEAEEARKAYVAAMARFKADPPTIIKDKHVSFTTTKGVTEYDHATLGAVCAAIVDGLAKQGISHSWDTTQSEAHVKVTCVLTHEFGHSERVSLHSAYDDSGGKNAIQALGSAITYLQRYTLFAATGLAAMEDDDGRSTGGPPPAETDQMPWPDGYKAFRESMPAIAKKGTRELRKTWEATDEKLRTFATTKDLMWWNEQKAAAAQIDKAAELVKR